MVRSKDQFTSLITDNPHLISAIEQQKLKFLVANNEPKKDNDGSSPDKKAAGRKVKIEDKGEELLSSATLEGKEDGQREGMNRASVGESMHQIKLMNHTATNNSQGSEEISPSSASTSAAGYKKVDLILSVYNIFCLLDSCARFVCSST